VTRPAAHREVICAAQSTIEIEGRRLADRQLGEVRVIEAEQVVAFFPGQRHLARAARRWRRRGPSGRRSPAGLRS
jgi:hypothetical protein